MNWEKKMKGEILKFLDLHNLSAYNLEFKQPSDISIKINNLQENIKTSILDLNNHKF